MPDIERLDPAGHLSAAVAFDKLVFVSGQVAEKLDEGITAQTQSVLAKLDRLLNRAGSDRTRILFAQIWLKDIGDRDAVNAVWSPWIGAHPSARACVQSALANPKMLIEIAAIAARN